LAKFEALWAINANWCIFAVGAVSQVGELAKNHGAKKALIITDPFLAGSPIVEKVKASLEKENIEVTVFGGVTPNPTTACVDEGSDVAAASGADILIALGGGSSMDTAKGVSLGARNPQRGLGLDYTTNFEHEGVPIIAIPTTAGTGSEVNAFGVITDEVSHRRFYVGHSSALAKAAILDPELTVGLPPKATAATGMDALIHAVESYLSIRSNPYSDAIALGVVEMVSQHLLTAVETGTNIEARSQMLLASHIAGVGFSHTGLGLVHGIGHALGGLFNIPHGVALCLVLEEVMKYNLPVRTMRIARLAFALGVGNTNQDDKTNADAAISRIASLVEQVGLKGKLSDHGITEKDLETLAETTLADAVTINNPQTPTHAQVVEIMKKALYMFTAADEKRILDLVPKGLYLNGKWQDSSDGKTLDVIDPATGKVLATIADASAADGMAAITAADYAQAAWAKTAPRYRAEILRAAFEKVTAMADDFALLMSLEMGKPVAEAKGEVAYGAEFLRWFSEEAPRISGRYGTAPDGKNRIMVLKRPVGPSLFITPWNFPLAMATRKIGPAIAAGCTMVLKPAALTPLTSLLFVKILEECGVPAGVINVVQTTRPGEVTGPIIKDSRLRKLSFTGSTGVGRRLIADSADQVLKISMELGGNAPLIVFEDADLDKAIEGTMLAKLRNMGEACTAANRLIIHESVAAEYTKRLTEKMAALKVARGTTEGVNIGPLIDSKSRDSVHALVEDAVSKGAKVETGGAIPSGDGYFYPPTVLSNVSKDALILKEEVFGPVAPILTFKTEAEAVALANDTEFGLVAYAFTKDLNRGLRLAESLEVGMFGLNTGLVSNPAAPFGGIKSSGLGREGGSEGIEEYLETVYVGIADPTVD
jgi:succinate-semialdehyde dehydrogenase/glutarate-semialdehyde dehydrogenase